MIRVIYSELDGPEGLTLRLEASCQHPDAGSGEPAGRGKDRPQRCLG